MKSHVWFGTMIALSIGVTSSDNNIGYDGKTYTKPLKFNAGHDTYFKSKSYQGMVIMNGSGDPISEKKMSAFSVEDHQDGDQR